MSVRVRSSWVFLIAAVSGGLLAAPRPGAEAAALAPAAGLRNDVRASWVLFETSPIAPLAAEPEWNLLFAVNQPGLRLSVLALDDQELLAEVPVGPGVVSVVRRPTTEEVWVVDAVTHSVGVLDLTRGTLVRTIRLLGREPHGLAFSPDGQRAWVACSGSATLDSIDAAAYRVAKSIDLPVLGPRSVVFRDGVVWVAPFLSGNNTTTYTATGDDLDVDRVVEVTEELGLNPLPDRDLLGVRVGATPLDDALDTSLTVQGLGTVLFNLHARPGTSELWIPCTRALNAEVRGEKNFVGGQVVRNGIAIVDTETGARTFVDLDAIAPDGEACAQPTAVAFRADGERAWVAGFGSDRVVELEASNPASGWTRSWSVTGRDENGLESPGGTAAGAPGRSGPRGLAATPGRLFVSNRVDGSLTAIELHAQSDTSSSSAAAPAPVSIGYDPTPPSVRRGRGHLVNADHSASGTSSCAACHVDGHLDGLAWDLSGFLDPEGTPAEALAFPVDLKGPMVTQTLRSIEDNAPYHWRGEKADLGAFNAAFVGLLERDEPLTSEEFDDLADYVFSLHHPANPRQAADRSPSPAAAEGLGLFLSLPVFDDRRCVDCHPLPSGSSNEPQGSVVNLLALSTQPTRLPGVGDKLGKLYDVGGTVGPHRTEQGAGLTHAAGRGDLGDFLASSFDLAPEQFAPLIALLEEFDTGLAPATAWQGTAHPGNLWAFATDVQDGLGYALAQAEAGAMDLVAHVDLTLAGTAGAPVRFGLFYDPAVNGFRASAVGTLLSIDWLLGALSLTSGHATFFGLPLGMGERWAFDRDNDGLAAPVEDAFNLSDVVADADGDGYPDGWELERGMSPWAPDDEADDALAPEVEGAVTVVLATTNTVELEFDTSEVCRADLFWGESRATGPRETAFDDRFDLVLSGLPQGEVLELQLVLVDPAGNRSEQSVSVATRPWTEPEKQFVRAVSLIGVDPWEAELVVEVEIGIVGGGATPLGPLVSCFAYYEDDATGLVSMGEKFEAAADVTGTATFVLELPSGPAAGVAPGARVHFGVTYIEKVGDANYVEAFDEAGYVVLDL